MSCPGSGTLRTFSPGHVTKTSDATGLPSYARIRCPECDRPFTGRVVRTVQGIPVGEVVRTPDHRSTA